MQFGQDQGHPARYVHRAFDEVAAENDDGWEWTNDVVFTTPERHKHIELLVLREAGSVRHRIQKALTSGEKTRLEPVLELNNYRATRLNGIEALDSIPIKGESRVSVDDQFLRDVSADPRAMVSVYANDPERFCALIETDANARHVIALRHRREVAGACYREVGTWPTQTRSRSGLCQQLTNLRPEQSLKNTHNVRTTKDSNTT